MLGVEVPAGTHDVRFDYRPGWLVPGLLVMLLGVLLVMAMLVADDRRWNVHFTGAAAPDPTARTQSPPDSPALSRSSPRNGEGYALPAVSRRTSGCSRRTPNRCPLGE